MFVGSTIEEVCPSFDIISHSCRVSNKFLFLLSKKVHRLIQDYRYEIEKIILKFLKL